jgi:hypothetical protein
LNIPLSTSTVLATFSVAGASATEAAAADKAASRRALRFETTGAVSGVAGSWL